MGKLKIKVFIPLKCKIQWQTKRRKISPIRKQNEYEKIRELTVLENQKRLEALGIKNIAKSVTSLAQSQKAEKKTMKQNTNVVDVSRRQHPPRYISPMSTNRVDNLSKLQRVIAPNARKHTMNEIGEGNKGGAKRRLVLIDQDDDEDDEISQDGNIVDDVAQDVEFEDIDDTIHKNDRQDIQLADHDSVHEQLQGPKSEITAGVPKKGRGHTKKDGIWKLANNEIICVTFDQFGHPVGDEGRELGQYLGTLVRMGANVSMEYPDMYSLVKIKKWIFFSMGKKWRTWKGIIKSRGYDLNLTIDEVVTQQANNDGRVNSDQLKKLVTRWFTPEFQKTCATRRLSRSKMKEPHVTGTKSFARLAHEMAMKNDGAYPTRGEMYIKTRTRRDGSIVDDEAAGVVNSLKAIASDSTSIPGDQDDFANDDYSKVKGPEKRGYVRLVGRVPTGRSNGDLQITCKLENATQQLETTTQTISRLKGAFNVMVNIIQEHIPNANLSTLLNNMNVQNSIRELLFDE